jgi:hypothetical protein
VVQPRRPVHHEACSDRRSSWLIPEAGDDPSRRSLLESAPDDDGVKVVGTGPLEDLVTDHGDELVADIERTATQRSVSLAQGTVRKDSADRLSRWRVQAPRPDAVVGIALTAVFGALHVRHVRYGLWARDSPLGRWSS